MNKKNSSQIVMFMFFGLMLFIVISMLGVNRANYRPIQVSGPKDGSFFDLPVNLDCTAGSGKKDSPYSRGLTPGGICGAQEFVVNQSEYEMSEDSIGGSLI